MKKVVFANNADTVNIKCVDESKIYAMEQIRVDGPSQWSLITRTALDRGPFVGVVLDGSFTSGNQYNGKGHHTLQDFMTFFTSEEFRVWEFDTMKEAFKFLAPKL